MNFILEFFVSGHDALFFMGFPGQRHSAPDLPSDIIKIPFFGLSWVTPSFTQPPTVDLSIYGPQSGIIPLAGPVKGIWFP